MNLDTTSGADKRGKDKTGADQRGRDGGIPETGAGPSDAKRIVAGARVPRRARRYPPEPAAQPPHPRLAADVTVLLPAHDEAATIAEVVGRTRHTLGPAATILVVDDGSSDATAELAAAAGAQVLRLTPNRGKGLAVRRGLERVQTEVVVLLDADGQDHPEEIPALLSVLRDDVGLVIGSRFMGTFDRGAITAMNRAGSLVLRAALNALWGQRVTDPFAGFRAFAMWALRDRRLGAARYDIEIDMLLDLVGRGVRVVEVPVRRSPRPHGRSDLSSVRDGLRMLGLIVGRRLRRRWEDEPS